MHVAKIAADRRQGRGDNGLVKRRQEQRNHGAANYQSGFPRIQQ